MKISKGIRVLVTGATLAYLGTQAAMAFAVAECTVFWPATISRCSSSNDRADASGGFNVTNGANNRQVSTSYVVGSRSSIATALNSNGQAIAGCQVEDTSKDSINANKFCFSAVQPTL